MIEKENEGVNTLSVEPLIRLEVGLSNSWGFKNLLAFPKNPT
jgi:hypothetical protein